MSQERVVESFEDFSRVLGEILEENSFSKRSLQEYLLSLWALMQKHQDKQFTWQLMAQLIREAFTKQPTPFDKAWLTFAEPPEKLFKDSNSQDCFTVAKEMILYQIADLHRMKEAGTLDLPASTLYFGVDSPTNNRWYNFDPQGFLERASAYLTDTEADDECDWNLLARFLYAGQTYE